MAYDPAKLALVAQGIYGGRIFRYEDTGGETAAVYAGAGFFTTAGNYGADTGDSVYVFNKASSLVYSGRFSAVQDTGATQGTVVLDTGGDGAG